MLSQLDRALGALYGQFIGDALGSRYESLRATQVAQKSVAIPQNS